VVGGPTSWRELRAPLALGIGLSLFSYAIICFVPALAHQLYGDARLYENWGTLVANHQVPYRDFDLEYPPGAVPAFVAPVYAHKLSGYLSTYFFWFRIEIAACTVLAVLAAAVALRQLGASRRRSLLTLGAIGIGPLLLGPIEYFHYDAWPALFLVGAVAALLANRPLLSSGLAAFGMVAKVFPILVLPFALAELWRRARWRGVAAGLGIAGAVVALTVGPFAVIAPDGVAWALRREHGRPLQVESVAATVFTTYHQLAGGAVRTVQDYGSRNLVDHRTVASALFLLTLVALAAIYALWWRSRRGREELVLATTAAVVAYVVFSKVFSPQYLAWLIPLVPLVGGRLGARATGLFLAIAGMTQIWEPYLYDRYYRFDNAWLTWLVIGRNVLVVALLALLVAPLVRQSFARRREDVLAPLQPE
jgi:hypothetical protein